MCGSFYRASVCIDNFTKENYSIMSDARPFIMIVDDMLDNRILLESLLEDDYEVSQADSGEVCLENVSTSIDLILLDVNMPGMDGWTATRFVIY